MEVMNSGVLTFADGREEPFENMNGVRRTPCTRSPSGGQYYVLEPVPGKLVLEVRQHQDRKRPGRC